MVTDEIYNQYKEWYELNKNFKPIKYPAKKTNAATTGYARANSHNSFQ